MRSHEIRERFLRFFEERGHHVLPNTSLIPEGDPSLLFTVAGMVPLKPFISGERTPPGPRLVSCQRCFRGSGLTTDDISSVGDCTHNTFFEMLGNWSIGDYFKRGAIQLAWELLTGPFGLDPDRLRPSIYPDDQESLGIWTQEIGIPDQRVSRITDNWWQAGPTGPCGYDSEVYFDWGAPCSCGRDDCGPEDDCAGDRWTEIWNLVFMEWDQHADGSRIPLPRKTVDTGMGLERMATVMQGVRCIYDTDLLRPILDGFASRARGALDETAPTRSLRVLSDHVRGATFLIADGVLPSNEGRGYVLRRVIRRAALHARRLKLRGGLAAGVGDVISVMGEAYPELVARRELAEASIAGEEQVFDQTLEAATQRLEALLDSGASVISGDDAFRLYDTYGLPVELTVEMAGERGVSVDRAGFEAALETQRERGRRGRTGAGWRGVGGGSATLSADRAVTATGPGRGGMAVGDTGRPTQFVGYDSLEAEAVVLAIGTTVEPEALAAGEEGDVFLDTSPFYAEAGGQVGDTGVMVWPGGRARVLDCQLVAQGRAHAVRVEEGILARGELVTAEVDPPRRAATARHHSATHLLHKALREILGETAVQRGSLVTPDHATFDFSFPRALAPDELLAVERRLNRAVRDNLERTVAELPVAEARATGAMALFDEKYGDVVRVVDFGGWARELCGGTHVARSGDIGAALIVAETSIGQGTRRIELVAGEAAERRWEESEALLRETARTLRAQLPEVPERVAKLLEQNRELQRRPASAGDGLSALVGAAEVLSNGRVPFTIADSPELDGDDAASLADRLFAERLGGDGVAAVFGQNTVVIKAGAAAVAAGVDAGRLARTAAEAAGGRGGGQPGFGRGGLADGGRRVDSIATVRAALDREPRDGGGKR